MIILTKEDIQQCLSMEEAIKAAEQAVMTYTKGDAFVPLRANLDVKEYNGQSLYMPAFTKGEVPSLGVKIVAVYPDNIQKGLPSVPATMIVQDAQTGIVTAVLDGTYLTQLRTAAIQGAATKALANEDAKIGALIGTGGQGYQQALAMLTARSLDELRVVDIDFDRAQAFAETLLKDIEGQFDTKVYAVKEAREALDDADVITTVTTSKVNTFDAKDVKPGAHVNGIGAYTPEMLELPMDLIVDADVVIFDTKDGVLSEAGDIQAPIKAGRMAEEDFTGELGELLLGQINGRPSKEAITVFKSVGSAVLDTVTAQLIVQKAKEENIGQVVEF